METLEATVEWPGEDELAQGVDLWELMPPGASDIGKRRVHILLQVLDTQKDQECICNTGPGFLCDPECTTCEKVTQCRG
jgi:hypothetical protein